MIRADSFGFSDMGRYKNHGKICLSKCNPRSAGPLDFPRHAGGRGLEHPSSISAPAHRRAKQKTAFESSSKIFTKLLQSHFVLGQN